VASKWILQSGLNTSLSRFILKPLALTKQADSGMITRFKSTDMILITPTKQPFAINFLSIILPVLSSGPTTKFTHLSQKNKCAAFLILTGKKTYFKETGLRS
jgi:hypothetical protein